MSRLISWTLALLALPQIAAADVGNGSGGAARDPVAASGARTQEIPPVLDLRIRERLPPTGPEWLTEERGLGLAVPEPHSAPARNSAEKGLSFGLEVRRARQFQNRTRPDEDETPGLQGEIERLIEHSTLGIRGIYRY
jgi:hypothetical protein